MPYEKIMKLLGLGIQKTAAELAEEERKREQEEKKKKKGLQPHGRWQMKGREFEELEEASK